MVRSQRAQLILVGSIAIAIVLIGLTIVLNSAVFTENVAGGSSPTVTDEVTQFDREAVRNVRSLTVRINHASVYAGTGAGEAAIDADVGENVSTYSRLMAQSYADTGSVYVNVTYEGTETFGNRIVQPEDGDFSSNPGGTSWTPVDDPFLLGRFVMNVDVTNSTTGEPFFLNITDSDGSTLNVSMQKTTEGELDLNSSIDGGNVSETTCTPKNGRVLLDVVHGTAYTGDCSFNSTGYLEEPYTRLHFENGGKLRGKYDLVMNRSDPASLSGVPNCASVNDPCRSVAVWSVNVTTRYDRGSFSFERNHNVTVYDP